MDNKLIGTRIRLRRQELKLNQSILAELVETSQKQVSKWEIGSATPGGDKILLLAQALKTTPNYLLGYTDDPEPAAPPSFLTADEMELLEAFRKSGRQRELLDIAHIMTGPP